MLSRRAACAPDGSRGSRAASTPAHRARAPVFNPESKPRPPASRASVFVCGCACRRGSGVPARGAPFDPAASPGVPGLATLPATWRRAPDTRRRSSAATAPSTSERPRSVRWPPSRPTTSRSTPRRAALAACALPAHGGAPHGAAPRAARTVHMPFHAVRTCTCRTCTRPRPPPRRPNWLAEPGPTSGSASRRLLGRRACVASDREEGFLDQARASTSRRGETSAPQIQVSEAEIFRRVLRGHDRDARAHAWRHRRRAAARARQTQRPRAAISARSP